MNYVQLFLSSLPCLHLVPSNIHFVAEYILKNKAKAFFSLDKFVSLTELIMILHGIFHATLNFCIKNRKEEIEVMPQSSIAPNPELG